MILFIWLKICVKLYTHSMNDFRDWCDGSEKFEILFTYSFLVSQIFQSIKCEIKCLFQLTQYTFIYLYSITNNEHFWLFFYLNRLNSKFSIHLMKRSFHQQNKRNVFSSTTVISNCSSFHEFVYRTTTAFQWYSYFISFFDFLSLLCVCISKMKIALWIIDLFFTFRLKWNKFAFKML